MSGRRRQGAFGKLKAVARAWANPSARGGWRVDPESAGADALAAHLAKRKRVQNRERIEIAPDEKDSFMLFMAMSTQWRRIIVPMTAIILLEGMIYDALPSVARMISVKMTPALFADIRMMEAEAIVEASR